ncbi:MAG: sigma-54 dependent transcriptional regulator [Gammaproteobacteria bacterium]
MSAARLPKLCLIEDDPVMGESLLHRFELEGIACDWLRDGASAREQLAMGSYAAVISDIRLPDASGEELFEELLHRGGEVPPTLFITGFGSIDQAVRLLQRGARDYITKPFDLDDLLAKLETLCPEVFGEVADSGGEPVLGISPAMREIETTLQRVARHNANVLITGESGVGKEFAAHFLHRQRSGNHENQPFVAVNCAALTESLLEAELFGHEKGAFTGATRTHRGVFERADGGTLFLDEIGEMSPTMQAKLLRVIQERRLQRVGGETSIPVDVRLVCATNRDLQQMVNSGTFREDLFYRINVVHVHIPPLRERREDIVWFARLFTRQFAEQNSERKVLHQGTEQLLARRPWPGNLRELQHTIERACILTEEQVLNVEAIGFVSQVPDQEPKVVGEDLKTRMLRCECELIRDELEKHQWRIVETAESLGISRKSLWEKMRRHGLQEPGG